MSKNKVVSKREQGGAGTSHAEREQGRRDNGNAQHCGECCWFYGEDTYGYGFCPFKFADVRKCDQPCEAGEHFVSKKQMRHYQAVLLQANRYRRDPNVPAIYRMPNPTELGKAIDFAGEFIKVFSNL